MKDMEIVKNPIRKIEFISKQFSARDIILQKDN